VRRRARRIRWSAVLLLAVSFIALSGGVLLFTYLHPPRLPEPPPDPHARPLDFASYDLRQALDEYAMFVLGNGLARIDSACAGGREIYRAVHLPGLGGGEFVAVDLEISGSTATVRTWRFTVKPTPNGHPWQVAARRMVGTAEIDAIRTAAARLLLSDMPAAINDAYTDVADQMVETCRNERYHFFRRRDPVDGAPPDTPFNRFTGALLALRDRLQ